MYLNMDGSKVHSNIHNTSSLRTDTVYHVVADKISSGADDDDDDDSDNIYSCQNHTRS